MTLTPREQTNGFLARAQKILLVAPQKIDADSASALFAAAQTLTQAEKEVVAVSEGDIPSKLSFLKEDSLVRKSLGEDGDFVLSISTDRTKVNKVKYVIKDDSVDILVTPAQGSFQPADVSFLQSAGKFDLIVVFGAESLEDLGTVFENNTELFAATPVVNISVSPANEFFGNVNLVDPSRSAVCEILFELLEQNKSLVKFLDKQIATELLTGIIAQTDSFLDPVTTATSFEAASRLQALGADQSDIIEHIFKKKSLQTLKVWGRILGNLELDMVHRIAWSGLAKADFELADAKPEHIGDMVGELLRHTKGAELVALFVEHKKKSVIQVRSSNSNVNFADLQKFLGGSGELVRGGLDFEIEKKSVAEIQYQMLKLLVDFQKQRLQIPEEIEIQKMDITDLPDIHPAQTELPLSQKNGEKEVLATPPAHIPFEAPMQTEVPHTDIPMGTQAAEVTLDPNDAHVPDWLKKSFPDHK